MSSVSLAGMNKTRCAYFPAKNISCKAIVPFIYQPCPQGLAKGFEDGVDQTHFITSTLKSLAIRAI